TPAISLVRVLLVGVARLASLPGARRFVEPVVVPPARRRLRIEPAGRLGALGGAVGVGAARPGRPPPPPARPPAPRAAAAPPAASRPPSCRTGPVPESLERAPVDYRSPCGQPPARSREPTASEHRRAAHPELRRRRQVRAARGAERVRRRADEPASDGSSCT